jgi:hypothetical protein
VTPLLNVVQVLLSFPCSKLIQYACTGTSTCRSLVECPSYSAGNQRDLQTNGVGGEGHEVRKRCWQIVCLGGVWLARPGRLASIAMQGPDAAANSN